MSSTRGVLYTLLLVFTLSIGPAALLNALQRASPAAKAAQDPTSDPLAEAATAYGLLVSGSADRSNQANLQGQTVSGNIYVFVSPESGITQARFFIDNTSATGTPFQTENMAPWDLAGGNSGANPYDTRTLSNGGHTVTASLSLSSGATVVTTSSFTVNNVTATATPVPPTATATAATADCHCHARYRRR